jgi:hypothetical protein
LLLHYISIFRKRYGKKFRNRIYCISPKKFPSKRRHFCNGTVNYFMQPEPQGAVGGAAAAPPPHPPPRPPPPEAKKRKKEKAALLPVLAFTPTNKVIKMDHYNINKPAVKQQQQLAEAKQAVEQAAADSKAGQAAQLPKHIPGGTSILVS